MGLGTSLLPAAAPTLACGCIAAHNVTHGTGLGAFGFVRQMRSKRFSSSSRVSRSSTGRPWGQTVE